MVVVAREKCSRRPVLGRGRRGDVIARHTSIPTAVRFSTATRRSLGRPAMQAPDSIPPAGAGGGMPPSAGVLRVQTPPVEPPPLVRASFSCSPRDFCLPMETDSPRALTHARRHSARRLPSIPRDKNKLRVAELLKDEQRPEECEVQSEARLQRILLGQTTTQDLISRRARRMRGHPYPPTSDVLHRSRTSSLWPGDDDDDGDDDAVHLLSPMDTPLDDTEMESAPSPPAAAATTPMTTTTTTSTTATAAHAGMCPDEDLHTLTDDDLHVPLPPPATSTMDEHAWARSPSPRPGMKRKWDDDVLAARPRRPAPTAPWPSWIAPPTHSPRRYWGTGSATLSLSPSPSSSPLALHAHTIPRRPSLTSMPMAFSPRDETPAYLARSPGTGTMMMTSTTTTATTAAAAAATGSGPGYGHSAIGLRIGGARAIPIPTAQENAEMDEGVRQLGLT